jgi:hypothetical protein
LFSKLVQGIESRLLPLDFLWMSGVTFILLFGTGMALRQTSGIVSRLLSGFFTFLGGAGFFCCVALLGLHIIFSLKSSRKQ